MFIKEIIMKRNFIVIAFLLLTLALIADLEVAPGVNYDMVGPAYSGELIYFVSDTLYVTNTGATDEFTLHLETSEIPAGWNVTWCHDYEDALCHFPIFPWTFTFIRDTVILIDIAIAYESSPGSLDLSLFWSAGSIDDVVMDFTFRTEDAANNSTDDVCNIVTLSQNYPNPFNPQTCISFYLPQSDEVKMNVYNIKGELIAKLIDEKMPEGKHEFVWNALNSLNRPVPSGLYFYQISTSNSSITRKMILMK